MRQTRLSPFYLMGCLFLLLIPFCVSSALNLQKQTDCIESFTAHMTINDDGDIVITEDCTVRVGHYPAKDAAKIDRGYMRRLPLLTPNHISYPLTIDSVSRNGQPTSYEISDENGERVLRIRGEEALQRNCNYRYSITYHYPGLVHHGLLLNDKLLLDWQMTMSGLLIEKALIKIQLPSDAQLADYVLKSSDSHHLRYYCRTRDLQEKGAPGQVKSASSYRGSFESYYVEQNGRHISVLIDNQSKMMTPLVGIELGFYSPKYLSSLQEMQSNLPKTPPFYAQMSPELAVVGGAVVAGYLCLVKIMRSRREEYEKKLSWHRSRRTYDALSWWEKYYLHTGKLDNQALQMLLYQWQKNDLVSFKLAKNDGITLEATAEQRQKMSSSDLKLLKIFFPYQRQMSDKTWAKTIEPGEIANWEKLLTDKMREIGKNWRLTEDWSIVMIAGALFSFALLLIIGTMSWDMDSIIPSVVIVLLTGTIISVSRLIMSSESEDKTRVSTIATLSMLAFVGSGAYNFFIDATLVGMLVMYVAFAFWVVEFLMLVRTPCFTALALWDQGHKIPCETVATLKDNKAWVEVWDTFKHIFETNKEIDYNDNTRPRNYYFYRSGSLRSSGGFFSSGGGVRSSGGGSSGGGGGSSGGC